MVTLDMTITLTSFWGVGSGRGQGKAVDSLVCKDQDNLPIIPGKSLKGLFRNAVQELKHYNHYKDLTESSIAELFGSEGDKSDCGTKYLRFNNAELNEKQKKWLKYHGKELINELYQTICSVKLNQEELAEQKQLRSIEVCVPLVLKSRIIVLNNEIAEIIKQAAPLIKELGLRRNRGYGRCSITLSEPEKASPSPEEQKSSDTSSLPNEENKKSERYWLLIELLDDLIISKNSSTKGLHQSHDYIPGSVLFGAVARTLFEKGGPELAFSGRIRFSPGFLLSGKEVALPMPLSYHGYKPLTSSRITLVNGLTHNYSRNIQLEQLRTGHVLPNDAVLNTMMNRSTRSARNEERFGAAEEAQLFGYESIARGQRFLTCLQMDGVEENIHDDVLNLLTSSSIRLGRSKSAEFGRCRISQWKDTADPLELYRFAPAEVSCCVFLLLSDLALYRDGQPSLMPEARDFGLDQEGCSLSLERSFIQTRSYSPWNTFHGCPELQRQVLCRGSVLSFSLPDGKPLSEKEVEKIQQTIEKGVGQYRYDGLGQVLFNPPLLFKKHTTLYYTSGSIDDGVPVDSENKEVPSPELHHIYLGFIQKKIEGESLVLGRKWAEDFFKLHNQLLRKNKQPPGRSQWAKIRTLSLRSTLQLQPDNPKIETGNTLSKLIEDINQFCGEDRRKFWWQTNKLVLGGRSKDMHSILKTKLDKAKKEIDKKNKTVSEELKVLQAVHHSAAEMMRKLQRKNNPVENKQ